MKFSIMEQLFLDEDLNAIYDKFYSEGKPQFLPREDFDTVISLDPTFDNTKEPVNNKLGDYGKWLLTQFRKNNFTKDNFNDMQEVLNDFHARKRYLNNAESKGEGKEANKGSDINAYKTIDEIRAALNCIELTTSQRDRKNRRMAREYEGASHEAIFVGENDKWEIWRPLTYLADKVLGAGSTWCTASSSGGDNDRGEKTGYFYSYTVGLHKTDNPNYDEAMNRGSYYGYRYNDNGKLYVFLNKNDKNEKYQARVGDATRDVTDFMDIRDHSVNFIEWVAKENLLDTLLATELSDVKQLLEVRVTQEVLSQDTLIVADLYQ